MDHQPIVLTLPALPPSVNHLYATVRKGSGKTGTSRVKSQEYRRWLIDMGWWVRKQTVAQLTGPVALTIEMRRPSANCDASNRIKAAEDLLQYVGVVVNDKQVTDVRARWDASADPCRITIQPIGG